jgi:hypothetical protein
MSAKFAFNASVAEYELKMFLGLKRAKGLNLQIKGDDGRESAPSNPYYTISG